VEGTGVKCVSKVSSMGLMSRTWTWAPRAFRMRAAARPMPELAPVN
jgi:hypothetical protein